MNTELQNAIHNSVKSNDTVTVQIDSESDLQKAFEELISDGAVASFDFRDYSHTLRNVWGTDIEGNQWRVNLQQAERTGSARYAE